MKVIVVNGQGESGKDEFEKLIIKQSEDKICKISIIDSIKSLARIMRWDGNKDIKSREFLSQLKLLAENFNDYPYQIIKEKLELLESCNYDTVFIDARSPRDIKRLVKDFNAITILVKRTEPAQFNNEADDGVFNYTYDYEFDNSGTIEDLKKKSILLYNLIITEENGKEDKNE